MFLLHLDYELIAILCHATEIIDNATHFLSVRFQLFIEEDDDILNW